MVTDGGAGQAHSQTVFEKHYRRFGLYNLRLGLRRWRRSRPFWAGLWTILAGLFIMAGPLSAFKVIFIANEVVVGLMVGALTSIFGLFLWFAPAQRQLFGVLIVLSSIASFFLANFGGFLIGMLLGMIGGSMGFAWVEVPAAQVGSKGRLFRVRSVISRTRPAGADSTASEPAVPEALSTKAADSGDAGDPAVLAKKPSNTT